MSIDRRIHDLLFDHDCVIVPEFGGFLVHYKGARIDEMRKLVHPPGKEVGFNKQLTRNDGLLVDALAKLDGVRFEQAKDDVSRQVEQWQRTLNAGGRVEVSGVGAFWTDAQRNLRFEPDPQANFLKDAFGLKAVAAQPVAKPVAVPQAEPKSIVRQLEPVIGPVVRTDRRPILWAASAAAAVLFAVATLVVAPAAMDNGQQLGGWFGWLKPEPALYVERASIPSPAPELSDETLTLPDSAAGAVSIAVDEEHTLHVAPVNAPTAVPDTTHVATSVVAPLAAGKRFHVMGGCFSVRENANNLVARLRSRGFDANIVDQHKGLWRVAIGSYANEGVAVEALVAARKEEAPGAWILHK